MSDHENAHKNRPDDAGLNGAEKSGESGNRPARQQGRGDACDNWGRWEDRSLPQKILVGIVLWHRGNRLSLPLRLGRDAPVELADAGHLRTQAPDLLAGLGLADPVHILFKGLWHGERRPPERPEAPAAAAPLYAGEPGPCRRSDDGFMRKLWSLGRKTAMISSRWGGDFCKRLYAQNTAHRK